MKTVTVTDDLTVRLQGRSFGPGEHGVSDDVADALLTHRSVELASGPGGSDGSASAIVDQHHATVRAAIEDGDVDDRLDAVEAAEQDRDSPRDSVLEAIATRREQVE